MRWPTGGPERLHIDFTKDAYRASNKKDELSQMTVWLERKEKVLRHEKFIQWRLQQRQQLATPRSTQVRNSLPLALGPLRGPGSYDLFANSSAWSDTRRWRAGTTTCAWCRHHDHTASAACAQACSSTLNTRPRVCIKQRPSAIRFRTCALQLSLARDRNCTAVSTSSGASAPRCY